MSFQSVSPMVIRIVHLVSIKDLERQIMQTSGTFGALSDGTKKTITGTTKPAKKGGKK